MTAPTFTAPSAATPTPAAADDAGVTWEDTHYGHRRTVRVSLRHARARGLAATPAATSTACARIVATTQMPGGIADLHRVRVLAVT